MQKLRVRGELETLDTCQVASIIVYSSSHHFRVDHIILATSEPRIQPIKSSTQNYMTRKAASKALVPPTLGEDAAERKRVLNVLAQRRYRKKKKERMQALESRANDLAATPIVSSSKPASRDDSVSATSDSASRSQGQVENAISMSSSLLVSEENCDTSKADLPFTLPIPDLFEPNSDLLWNEIQSEVEEPWKEHDLHEADPFWSLLNMPSPGTAGALDFNDYATCDKQPAEEFPNISADAEQNISDELQSYDTTFFTFPDDHTLQVPSLTLLNAAMRVAQQLKVSDIIWDITAISPFYQASSSSPTDTSISLPSLESGLLTSDPSPTSSGNLQIDINELPSHLQPTRTQRLIAHHPLLDLLPWPSTRDKLIEVFHLPVHMRPGNAQDPMGLVRLVYDMEDDSGEGVTVTGQNPFEPGIWEIGQLVFERWWWAFDTSVVESSNRSRENRGKARLAIKA